MANPTDILTPTPSFDPTRIPDELYSLDSDALFERALELKKELGDQLIILAHHYQREETYRLSDETGDSLHLARQAASISAKYIIFCGVHFMAESCDIVTPDSQITILPELSAGCSMADMADIDTVTACWNVLTGICGEDSFVPITYINSPATLKAFCGEHGGTVCTSSNSTKILKWALDSGKRVLFFPDQHLGRNTANQLGIPKDQIMLWDRFAKDGGLSESQITQSKILLWNGYCAIHQRFTVEQIEAARKRRPDIKVIVHPECPEDVVQASDYSGSTDEIIRTIASAPPDSEWAVGTENNLVNRLAIQYAVNPHKYIESLNATNAICSTMYSVHPAKVVWVLERLIHGDIVNQITVPEAIKQPAKIALDRMLNLSA